MPLQNRLALPFDTPLVIEDGPHRGKMTPPWIDALSPGGSGGIQTALAPFTISGASIGTDYHLVIHDTTGAPGISLYDPAKRAGWSAGATAAFAVQDQADTFRLIVLQNGNVLIGATTDQNYKLYVAGTLRVTSNTIIDGSMSVGGQFFATNKATISGTLAGTTYTLELRDTAGSPGINLYSSTTIKRASWSAGATACLAVQDELDLFRLIVLQSGRILINRTTEDGSSAWLQSVGGLNTPAASFSSGGNIAGTSGVVTITRDAAHSGYALYVSAPPGGPAVSIGGQLSVGSTVGGSGSVFAVNGDPSGFGVVADGNYAGIRMQNISSGATRFATVLTSSIGGNANPEGHAGVGSPEGVVTAPVGSWYHRVDGGAGTTFYVKESGSGNTGWVGK